MLKDHTVSLYDIFWASSSCPEIRVLDVVKTCAMMRTFTMLVEHRTKTQKNIVAKTKAMRKR